jgi:IS1 family transposase
VVIRQLAAEADAMWSVVKKKANKPWIGIAMDANTRQLIAFHVSDRRRDRAKEVWANIPLVSREHAMFPMDHYDAYQGVIPAERHRAITQNARKTNHSERFHHTWWQRLSRVLRDTLSFSALDEQRDRECT